MRANRGSEPAARLSRIRIFRGYLGNPPWINAESPRPRTVAECIPLGRRGQPCPFVSCGYHLAIDVDPKTGSVQINVPFDFGEDGVPDLDLEAMPWTCALRAAEEGGMTLDRIGDLFGVTRERIRQIESRVFGRVRRLPVLQHADRFEPVPRGDEPATLHARAGRP